MRNEQEQSQGPEQEQSQQEDELKPRPIPHFENVPDMSMPSPGPKIGEDHQNNAYISDWSEALQAIKDSGVDSTVADMWKSWRIKVNQEDKSSPVATQDQIDEAMKDVGKFDIPDGARLTTLSYLKKDQLSKELTKSLLRSSKPGFLSAAAQVSGHLIGSVVTDPVAAVSAAAVGLAVGAIAAPEFLLGAAAVEAAEVIPLLVKETGSLTNALLRFTGFKGLQVGSEFASFQISQELGKKTLQTSLDKEYDGLQGLINVVQQGVFGAVLGPAASLAFKGFHPKFRKLFSDALHSTSEDSVSEAVDKSLKEKGFSRKFRETFSDRYKSELNEKGFGNRQSEDAAQTVLNQMSSGKDPDPSMPYRHGIAISAKAFKERMAADGVNINDVSDALLETKKAIEEKHKPISDEVDRQDGLLEKHNLNISKLTLMSEELKRLAKFDELKLSGNDAIKLKAESKSIKDQIQDVAASTKAVKREITEEKPRAMREHKDVLVKQRIKDRIKPLQDKLDNIGTSLERFDKFKEAQKRVRQIGNEVKPFLKEALNGPATIDKYLNSWQELFDKNMEFEHLKASNGMFQHFIDTDETEIPNQAINDFIKDQDSPESNFSKTGGHEELEEPGRDFDNPTNLLNDTYPEEYQKKILPDENLLSKDEKETFDRVKSSGERLKLFRDAFTKILIPCLLGGGGDA